MRNKLHLSPPFSFCVLDSQIKVVRCLKRCQGRVTDLSSSAHIVPSGAKQLVTQACCTQALPLATLPTCDPEALANRRAWSQRLPSEYPRHNEQLVGRRRKEAVGCGTSGRATGQPRASLKCDSPVLFAVPRTSLFISLYIHFKLPQYSAPCSLIYPLVLSSDLSIHLSVFIH